MVLGSEASAKLHTTNLLQTMETCFKISLMQFDTASLKFRQVIIIIGKQTRWEGSELAQTAPAWQTTMGKAGHIISRALHL